MSKIYSCDKCGFKSLSKQGLNLHNTKMHKGLSKSKDSLPKDDPKCSVCHKSVHTTEAEQSQISKKNDVY